MARSHGAHRHDERAHGGARDAHAADHAHPPAHEPSGAFTAREKHQAGRLGMVLGLVGLFFALELAGALAAESVVLQASALHLLTDVLALAGSLAAMRVAVRRPTPRFTYGLRRVEPLAAIGSGLLVLATTAGIVVEGIEALRETTPPKAGLMLLVAVGALIVNGASAWLLHDAIHPSSHGAHSGLSSHAVHGHALNLRGAWLHLLGDTLGALAALIAAVVIRFGGPAAADPIASFVVAAILLYGSVRLLKDATLVVLEASPPHLSVAAIRRVAAEHEGVEGVRDLHVWTLGAGHDAITLHVRAHASDPALPHLAKRLGDRIRAEFGVEYVTVQVDLDG